MIDDWGLHSESVTVHLVSYGAPDASGVAVETVTDVVMGGCNVQQSTTGEQADGSVVAATGRWRVSCPLRQDITPGSRVTWRGRVFDVDGDPAHFYGTGVLDHTEFAMTARTGG